MSLEQSDGVSSAPAPAPESTSAASSEVWRIGGHEFRSRLLVGTGKYPDFETMRQCHEASSAEIVTVALRRVDLKAKQNVLDFIDTGKFTLLPNTAGCYTADDAIKICRLAREMALGDLVKLEVIGDERTLLPDMVATLEACEVLANEGFVVMAYTTDDPVMARRMEAAGASAIMPLGAPIGSGLGILNPLNITFIREMVKVPVLVDAGVGAASDVASAMELGVEAVLLNTAIASAQDPVKMALAMRHACEAGRLSYLAGRIPKKRYASASSPILDFLSRD
jgi:thiazole synthase